jgi:hypothetical protein
LSEASVAVQRGFETETVLAVEQASNRPGIRSRASQWSSRTGAAVRTP